MLSVETLCRVGYPFNEWHSIAANLVVFIEENIWTVLVSIRSAVKAFTQNFRWILLIVWAYWTHSIDWPAVDAFRETSFKAARAKIIKLIVWIKAKQFVDRGVGQRLGIQCPYEPSVLAASFSRQYWPCYCQSVMASQKSKEAAAFIERIFELWGAWLAFASLCRVASIESCSSSGTDGTVCRLNPKW